MRESLQWQLGCLWLFVLGLVLVGVSLIKYLENVRDFANNLANNLAPRLKNPFKELDLLTGICSVILTPFKVLFELGKFLPDLLVTKG